MRYKQVRIKNHPVLGSGNFREHVVIATDKIGRCLRSDECVHHLNGDPTDNRPENITVMLSAEHSRLHQTGRKRSQKTRDKIAFLKQGNLFYANFVKKNGSQKRPVISEENKRRWAAGIYKNFRGGVVSEGSIRRLLRKHLPQVHWTTIESRTTESGIPDIEGCYKGKSFWIECKVAKGWKVHLRSSQIAWILRRVRAGGRIVVLVRQRGAGRDDLWMVAGWAARELRDGGLGALPPGAGLGRWAGGPQGWGWAGVLRSLSRAGQGVGLRGWGRG